MPKGRSKARILPDHLQANWVWIWNRTTIQFAYPYEQIWYQVLASCFGKSKLAVTIFLCMSYVPCILSNSLVSDITKSCNHPWYRSYLTIKWFPGIFSLWKPRLRIYSLYNKLCSHTSSCEHDVVAGARYSVSITLMIHVSGSARTMDQQGHLLNMFCWGEAKDRLKLAHLSNSNLGILYIRVSNNVFLFSLQKPSKNLLLQMIT